MKIMKTASVLAVTLALVGGSFAHQPAYAGERVKGPIAASSGSNAGGWIVGGLFISVASIIACAMIVGEEEDREMTAEEAMLSGLIPLGCLLREEFGHDD